MPVRITLAVSIDGEIDWHAVYHEQHITRVIGGKPTHYNVRGEPGSLPLLMHLDRGSPAEHVVWIFARRVLQDRSGEVDRRDWRRSSMLPRGRDLERLQHHGLFPGCVGGLFRRVSRLLRRNRPDGRDASECRDKSRTLRDVSPHVVRRSSREPTRLPDRVTIGERGRPTMDALVLASWNQASDGGPTAYGRVYSGFWKRWETALKPAETVVGLIAMPAGRGAGSSADIGAWHEPRQVQTWWPLVGAR